MDINNYSYTPHMLDEAPTHYKPCNIVTIERRTANDREYFVIRTEDGSTKAYNLQCAIVTARDLLLKGE